MSNRNQTRNEELANGISHIGGIIFCLIGMPFLILMALKHDNIVTFLSVFTFGIGMLLVYSFSAMYHLSKNEKLKKILNIGDHISIYFLIAGTYTPLMLIYLSQETALLFLGFMWFIVLVGSIFKIFYTNRFELLSTLLYLVMGWMVVFVIKPLLLTVPVSVFWWILAGGVSYTIGVYFFVKGDKKYYHTIWHFFVLLGTILHYVSIATSL
jgi:hemolysin III